MSGSTGDATPTEPFDTLANASVSGFNLTEPATSVLGFKQLRKIAPAPYSNADAAYGAWALELGVSSIGTDVTGSTSTSSSNWFSLRAPIPSGGTSLRALLSNGGGLLVYFQPPVAETGAFTTGSESSGSAVYSYAWKPTYRPFLLIGPRYSTAGNYTSYNLKIRSAEHPTTGAPELIGNYTHASTTSATTNPMYVAFRLRPGYLEIVVSVSTADKPAGQSAELRYLIGNQTTNAYTSGELLESDMTGTYVYRTVDMDATHPFLGDTPSLTEALSPGWSAATALADSPELTAAVTPAWGQTISQSATHAAATSYAFRPGALVEETIETLDVATVNGKYYPSLTDTAALTAALSSAIPMILADGPTITAAASIVRGMIIAEQMLVTPAALPQTTWYVALAQTMAISPSLLRFLSGSVAESVTMAQTQTVLWQFPKNVAEVTAITDALDPAFVLKATATDGVEITAAQVLQMVFSGVAEDGVIIEGLYSAPDGSVITWVMNTHTGAVTEYTNFSFNSFARVGNKYLGASSDGLYELNGDDDDGANILPVVAGGYAQFNGSRYSSLGNVYLGFHSGGTYVLKIETGDGKVYNYAVTARDMQTTRVNLGKGLRSRYFTYTLTGTDGADFDLDSIEFLPVTARRRV